MNAVKPVVIGAFGVLAFFVGVFLRFNSKDLAWQLSLSGARDNSAWVIHEAAYNDVALALLALGVGLLLVSAHAMASTKK